MTKPQTIQCILKRSKSTGCYKSWTWKKLSWKMLSYDPQMTSKKDLKVRNGFSVVVSPCIDVLHNWGKHYFERSERSIWWPSQWPWPQMADDRISKTAWKDSVFSSEHIHVKILFWPAFYINILCWTTELT